MVALLLLDLELMEAKNREEIDRDCQELSGPEMETVQECLEWNDQTCLSTKEDRSIYKRNNGTGGEYEFTGTMLIMVLDGMHVCR